MAVNERGPRLMLGSTSKSTVMVYNGYKYVKNRTRQFAVYWRCHRHECRVTCSTQRYDEAADNPNITIKTEPRQHRHQEDTTKINTDLFRQDAIRRAREDTTRGVYATYTVKNLL